MSKNKTGTKEWAFTNINIQRGCEHNCRYCYARSMAVQYETCEARHWPYPVINNKKVEAAHKKKYPGRVMFPSTHDITPANLSQYLCVLRKLLDAGNDVLIVSKPHLECIEVICASYLKYQNQITFRFTIGSTDSEILKFWEPAAPDFAERLACLQYAFDAGYETSVSCEPYLDQYPGYTYAACRDFITDEFWIGKLNKFKQRVDLSDVSAAVAKKFAGQVLMASRDDVVKAFHKLLDGQPGIKWKDSIRTVLGIEN